MKTGFIGTGVMGGALARAVRKSVGGDELLLSNVPSSVSEALASELGCIAADNGTVAAECKYIFLAVKPYLIRAVAEEILPVLRERSDRYIIVSVAAGVRTEDLKAVTGNICPVIRIMPNTPVQCGAGIVLASFDGVTDEEEKEFFSLIAAAGVCDKVSEKMIETAGTLTGCGPAFAYVITQALADGAVAIGVDRAHAVKYAELTLLGAAKLAYQTGKHPEQLKDEVCSPGGSTIEGVLRMEQAAVRAALEEAVKASYKKNLELGK